MSKCLIQATVLIIFIIFVSQYLAFQVFSCGSVGKKSACNAGEGDGNTFQCSCVENPRDSEPAGLPSMGWHRVRHD